MCVYAFRHSYYIPHKHVHPQVWRIACRDYDPSLKGSKSLTPAIYERVGDLFRDRYGPHAGWCVKIMCACVLFRGGCVRVPIRRQLDPPGTLTSQSQIPTRQGALPPLRRGAAQLPQAPAPRAADGDGGVQAGGERGVQIYICVCSYVLVLEGVCIPAPI